VLTSLNCCFFWEDAYVSSFTHTTYSRFTSAPIKRSRFIIPLEDSEYVVELAYVSARFSPLGPIVIPLRILYGKGCFRKNPKFGNFHRKLSAFSQYPPTICAFWTEICLKRGSSTPKSKGTPLVFYHMNSPFWANFLPKRCLFCANLSSLKGGIFHRK
jgi:hypothetical protein